MTRFVLARVDEFSLETETPVIPADALPVVGEAIDVLRRVQAIRGAVLRGGRRRFAQAREEGLLAGREAGARQAAEALAEAVAALDSALRQARAAHEARVVDVALAVVARIAGEVGDPTIVAGLARRALADLDADAPVRIRVHPTVADAVAEAIGRDGPASLEVLPDPALDALGCEIDAEDGVVEAGLRVQLGRIRDVLSGASGPA